MNRTVKEQLQKLIAFHFNTDNHNSVKGFNEPFTEIIFSKKKSSQSLDEIRVTFEDYIIKPFDGFDFHDKWNNGQPPYAKVMYGKIVGETKGMYKLSVHSETSTKFWIGWCPKKSCKIKEM